MTDQELEQIYQDNYRAVYWTAMSLLKNEADAEDIVQDTFLSLYENYESIQDKSKVSAWLKKTAANKSLDRIKLTKTTNVDDEFLENAETVPENFLPESIVESKEKRKIIMDIIDSALSEDIKRTLILFYFDEMSTKEIAKALEIPEGSVSRRLNFARNKIKKEVEKYEKDNQTKLHAMAIPFLGLLFIKEAEQVEIKPMPASLRNLSASTNIPKNQTLSKASSEAVKKGTGIMKNKIIIGCVALVVVAGAAAGIIFGVTKAKKANNTPAAAVSTVADEEKEGSLGPIAQESETLPQAPAEDANGWDISYLSPDEIADMLFAKFDTPIPEGSPESNILDRFDKEPANRSESSALYYFVDYDKAGRPNDYIELVSAINVTPPENEGGEVKLYTYPMDSMKDQESMSYNFHVKMYIKDEARAEAVYKALCQRYQAKYGLPDDGRGDDDNYGVVVKGLGHELTNLTRDSEYPSKIEAHFYHFNPKEKNLTFE